MFILFAYDYSYPQGGMNDIEGVYLSLREAKDAFDCNSDEAQIAEVTPNGIRLVCEGWSEVGVTPPSVQWTDVIHKVEHVTATSS